MPPLLYCSVGCAAQSLRIYDTNLAVSRVEHKFNINNVEYTIKIVASLDQKNSKLTCETTSGQQIAVKFYKCEFSPLSVPPDRKVKVSFKQFDLSPANITHDTVLLATTLEFPQLTDTPSIWYKNGVKIELNSFDTFISELKKNEPKWVSFYFILL